MSSSKNIFLDFIFILLTAGLWNIWMQYRQIRDYNDLKGYKAYSFLKWLLLTLITFGIYHIYHEYKLTRDLYILSRAGDDPEVSAIIAAVVSATGFWVFVDIYQQILLNRRIEGEL